MKNKIIFWISGTIVALAGVIIARLLAPALTGVFNKITLVCGYVLALTGIIVLAYACAARLTLNQNREGQRIIYENFKNQNKRRKNLL
ncbi:MAG TPA: hypothetical protein ENN23_10105 [Deltaproteobacteria bacterium]|nr:hypothetical protein [Deltaproteobacteria bacterium]